MIPLLIAGAVGAAAAGAGGAALAATLSGASCEAIRRVVVTATMTRYGSTATMRTGIYLRSTMTGAQ